MKENKKIKFVFLGDGRAKNHLEEKSKEKGLLGKSVYFPGRFPIESMPYFMSRASVLLVSLKDELIFNLTVPSKVQFYMAQKKPILAMLNGDGAELVQEADCGISVPANDEKSFARAVEKMSEMPKEELSKMGQSGKSFYEKNFRKEQRMEQLWNMLNESSLIIRNRK